MRLIILMFVLIFSIYTKGQTDKIISEYLSYGNAFPYYFKGKTDSTVAFQIYNPLLALSDNPNIVEFDLLKRNNFSLLKHISIDIQKLDKKINPTSYYNDYKAIGGAYINGKFTIIGKKNSPHEFKTIFFYIEVDTSLDYKKCFTKNILEYKNAEEHLYNDILNLDISKRSKEFSDIKVECKYNPSTDQSTIYAAAFFYNPDSSQASTRYINLNFDNSKYLKISDKIYLEDKHWLLLLSGNDSAYNDLKSLNKKKDELVYQKHYFIDVDFNSGIKAIIPLNISEQSLYNPSLSYSSDSTIRINGTLCKELYKRIEFNYEEVKDKLFIINDPHNNHFIQIYELTGLISLKYNYKKTSFPMRNIVYFDSTAKYTLRHPNNSLNYNAHSIAFLDTKETNGEVYFIIENIGKQNGNAGAYYSSNFYVSILNTNKNKINWINSALINTKRDDYFKNAICPFTYNNGIALLTLNCKVKSEKEFDDKYTNTDGMQYGLYIHHFNSLGDVKNIKIGQETFTNHFNLWSSYSLIENLNRIIYLETKSPQNSISRNNKNSDKVIFHEIK